MAPVLELSDAAHSHCLLVELNEQRLRGQFCDVTIIAEDTKFPAHKNVLAASSPYFKEVLSEEPAGRQPAQVLELPDIQAGVFSDILNFIYRSRLSVPSPAAARQIGAAGRRLGISWLENLDPAAQAKEMSEPWSPEAAGDTSASSPRSCGSPVDLTCPSRPAASPVCLQEPARPPSPQREADNETETAKILYALSTAPAEPGAPDWERERGAAEPPAAAAEGEPAPSSSSPAGGAFRCGLCSRSFATPAALSLHLQLHRSRRSLSCRHCGKSFIHVKRLQTHEVLCKEAEEEEEAAAGGSEAPAPAPAAPLPPAAPAPPKPASSKKGLLFRHRALQRLEYIPEQDHFVKVVDGHVIYFCTVCERSYMTLSSLKRHSNVHSWRRKYPCRYCDKVFALAEYRTKHEVWHTGERRYQCIFCWETFVTYYNLKTHQKAFHGINPGLISSEKTPNGGYKPRLNALKLYRLLPMRSQKRPYKTYSPGLLPEGLLLPPPPQPLPVALGEGDPAAGPGGEAGPGCGADAGAGPPVPAEEARRADGEAPSVIAYGHPAASVIVHSTSVAPAGGGGGQASSVITYNSAPAAPRPAPAEPLKKQVLKEYIQAQKAAAEQAPEEAGGGELPKPRSLRPGRTMTYMAKPAYVGAASESRSAPLCQITVRIGEEAIVKRRISETDLMLDKSPRGPKRFDFGPAEKAAPGKRAGGSYAHNESGEEESDRDAEDQLWRPYYTYKPKRKAGGSGGAGSGVPKVKRSSRWRRKLRSLRWMKRGEEEEEEREEPSPAPARASPSPGGSDAPAPEPAHKAGRGSAEWKHECGACGKLFSALKKLRKHERVHGRPGKDDLAPAPAHRVGRKPSVKFTCAHCAKVCKTAAALSRHMKRHEGESREPGPPALTTVIAYSKKPEEPEPALAAVKEEITQEMQVSSSSGEPPAAEASRGRAAGQPATPESQGAAPPREEEVMPPETGGPLEAAAPVAEAATTSRAELAPAPPAPRAALSLQDPVISHTSPAPPEEEEAAGGFPERYPVQEYPLPLLAPGGCRTRKEADDKPPFLAYPGPLPFGAVGKAGDGDGKVSFYPDPYPLMYGHQLLAAYPYNFTNLAALPVALNVVLPDDKGQPLPFLPSVFGYSVNPCRSEAQDGAGAHGAGSGAGGGAGLPRGGVLRGEPPAPERLKKGNFL
ncbi:zinc finger and BTB domain-containing protein 4 [Mauremys reevesii]|uniref:zinc finger and BTB domain-containing protein 4 n=1 Tax=Mauremys reevesii TaxID=260615 RepID=UPI00193F716E|nr:zinc finger and BTB domain-containing protein 4 [Mauremys reevesii]